MLAQGLTSSVQDYRLALTRWKTPKTQYIKDSRLERDANATEPAAPVLGLGKVGGPEGGA